MLHGRRQRLCKIRSFIVDPEGIGFGCETEANRGVDSLVGGFEGCLGVFGTSLMVNFAILTGSADAEAGDFVYLAIVDSVDVSYFALDARIWVDWRDGTTSPGSLRLC